MVAGAVLRVLIGALTAYPNRRRRQHLRKLHLASGRIQLLAEEIGLQMQRLQDFEESRLHSYTREAVTALNQLQVDLAERRTHLLTSEELCNLQRMKLRILTHSVEPPSLQPRPAGVATSDPPANVKSHRKDRLELENQLMGKIGQLKKSRDSQA